MDKTFKDLAAGFRLYPIWLHQAYYFLSSKYRRTALGSFWIAGQFVFLSVAITIVFGNIFQHDLRTYMPYVMLGNLVASMCLWTLAEAPELYMGSSPIIRNHAYPFTYFTFEEIARVLMLFGHNLIVFYIFMFALGTATIPHWTVLIGLPLNLLIMASWGSVVGLFAARFRDLRFLVTNISQMMFFLTPVYWHYDLLTDDHKWIADFNPLYAMVSLVREPLMGQAPTQINWTVSAIMASSGLVIWFISFTAFRRRIPFWV